METIVNINGLNFSDVFRSVNCLHQGPFTLQATQFSFLHFDKPHENGIHSLTLKAPITTAADDIHKYFFIVFHCFSEKIRLDV